MNTTALTDFWKEDGTTLYNAARYVLGARSRFLEDCRKWTQEGVATQEVTTLLGTLAHAPVEETQTDLAALLSCDLEEVERLYTTARGVLCCTGMALALRKGDIMASKSDWLPKALRCWGIEEKLPSPETQWTDDALRTTDALFSAFGSQDTGSHSRLLEIRDLLRYLLGAQPAEAKHTVVMRVLGIGKVNRAEKGFCPVLTLELQKKSEDLRERRQEKGKGFCRHPASLLLPCDWKFRQALSDSETFAGSGFLWREEERKWESGSVRWRLHMLTEEHLPAASGDSIGGAIGTGLVLLLTGESSDNIAMTACIDAKGKLGAVRPTTIPLKVEAAKRAGIHTILVESSQAGDFQHHLSNVYSGQPFELRPFETAVEAAEYIAIRGGCRGLYLSHVHTRSGQFDLLNGQAEIGGENGLYIEMPLLREVKREKLVAKEPRPGREGSGEGEGRMEQDPRPSFIRWEEWVMQEITEHQEVALDQVFRAAPHVVLIGPPGCGKSALGQYIAWRTSATVNRLEVAGKLIVPALVRLREWERHQEQGGSDLPTYLASQFSFPKGPSSEDWSRWLTDGDVLLLLDGLDEVSHDFVKTVAATVETYKGCLMMVSCRTISRERLDSVLKAAPVFTPAPFKEEHQKRYIRNYPRRSRGYDPEVLASELERSEIQMMATNPLLLSTICYVADAAESKRLPDTRTKLYEEAVTTILHKLMEGSPRRQASYVEEVVLPAKEGKEEVELRAIEVSETTKREALENLALEMFNSAERKIVFTELETKRALSLALRAEGHLGVLADTMLMDFRENSRLLSGRKGEDYSFLHPTYQEYLAACALARRAAKVGFDGSRPGESGSIARWEKTESEWHTRWREAYSKIDTAFKEADYQRADAEELLIDLFALIALLDHKAWLPEWQEVYLFLAGKLNDPVPLLDLLSNKERDDMFRHRLALAALCMAEIDPALRNASNGPAPGEPHP